MLGTKVCHFKDKQRTWMFGANSEVPQYCRYWAENFTCTTQIKMRSGAKGIRLTCFKEYYHHLWIIPRVDPDIRNQQCAIKGGLSWRVSELPSCHEAKEGQTKCCPQHDLVKGRRTLRPNCVNSSEKVWCDRLPFCTSVSR